MYCFGCGMRLIIRVGGRRISIPKDVLDWSPRDMLCSQCHEEIVGPTEIMNELRKGRKGRK